MSVKSIIKYSVPPILIDSLKRFRSFAAALPPEWEYLPSGWQDVDNQNQGWNVESVVQAQREKWDYFVSLTEGVGPLGIAHEASIPDNQDFGAHATIMSFAYIAAIATRHKESLSILDWGGGMGHYGVLARALLPGVSFDYHCKDVPLLCSAGRTLQSDFTFHENESSCFSRNYDLVVASSSIQYSKNWRAVFKSLANATHGWLYITRLPIVKKASSFVVLQRPYAHGYHTEYAGWFINRSEFLDHAESLGLVLFREFLVSESPYVKNAPDRCQYSGFLFSHSPA